MKRYLVACALLAVVGAGALWLPDWVRGGGAAQPQRPLAGATAANAATTSPAVRHAPVRVILVDGLARADTGRVPAFAALCARGLDVVVDVGFPTKSLPIQLALWTGLTQDQLGTPAVNLVDRPPPRQSMAVTAGGTAVVEAYRFIAAAAGFTVEPDAAADSEDAHAAPAAVRAWRDGGFAAAAERAVATEAPLVLVHILAVDEAAHHGGRSTARYAEALARADAIVTRVVAAVPAGAMTIILADHGHLARGGHGDAEDEVRRVRACVVPAPVSAPAAREIHLVDLSRLIADALGLRLDPQAVGRPIGVAIAHPDPDATMRRPSGARWSVALLLAAIVIAIGAYQLGRAGWVWSWPLAAYGIYRIAFGMPTLSATPTIAPIAATAGPVLALVIVALRRHGRRAVAIAAAGPAAMVTLVFAILARLPDALVTGTPPRAPVWTAHVTWAAQVLAIAATVAAVALLCPERGRPRTSVAPDPRRRGESPPGGVGAA